MAVKTATRVDPFANSQRRTQAGVFGMWLFIVAVVMIFGASILGYMVVRLDQPPGQEWKSAGSPGLPGTLLVSTALLLASGWTVQTALNGVRAGRVTLAHAALGWTLALALLFLGFQVVAWMQLWREQVTIASGLYAWTFYVLTGVHALHVLGGLPPLFLVFHRSGLGRYNAQEHAGIIYCAMYWHTLDAIWIVLYATLWLGSG